MTLPKKLPEWNKTALWMRVSTEEQTEEEPDCE